jgi:hypothetical protein
MATKRLALTPGTGCDQTAMGISTSAVFYFHLIFIIFIKHTVGIINIII